MSIVNTNPISDYVVVGTTTSTSSNACVNNGPYYNGNYLSSGGSINIPNTTTGTIITNQPVYISGGISNTIGTYFPERKKEENMLDRSNFRYNRMLEAIDDETVSKFEKKILESIFNFSEKHISYWAEMISDINDTTDNIIHRDLTIVTNQFFGFVGGKYPDVFIDVIYKHILAAEDLLE